ncbi:MAG: methyltransferase domain-containing protein [Woeseia sp.]
MSDADRRKWDQRYRTGAYGERDYPTPLLAEWASELPRGRALDVACGAGRNSLWLAAAGWQVDAVDISAAGLQRARHTAELRNLEVSWTEADLEEDSGRVLRGSYDLIVVVRYVMGALLPHLIESLAPGGILLCEQHVDAGEDVIGPKNPAFRFRHNELLREVMRCAAPGDRVLFYREGRAADPDGRPAALAQIVMRRNGSG